MEKTFLGIAVSKIIGVHVRGDVLQMCMVRSFRFDTEDDTSTGEAYVSWRGDQGYRRVLADEVIGIAWNEE